MSFSPVRVQYALLTLLILTDGSSLTDSSAAQAPSSLRVDRSEYQATCIDGKGDDCTYGFTIIASYVNPTADTLFIARCDPRDHGPEYGVEAVDDTAKQAGYDPVWGCAGHDYPIVVAPRATRVDTLRLSGPNVWDGKTNKPWGSFDGKFRLIYRVARCWAGGRGTCNTLPKREHSEPFVVHVTR
jgi:hypothetical protein